MSEILKISLKQSYLSFANLRELGYIVTNEFGEKLVKVVELVPFFSLVVDSGLKGTELIAYSYLMDKSNRYGWIDKFHDALARDLSLSIMSFKLILHKLYKKGFLGRMRRGHQVLLRPIKKDVH